MPYRLHMSTASSKPILARTTSVGQQSEVESSAPDNFFNSRVRATKKKKIQLLLAIIRHNVVHTLCKSQEVPGVALQVVCMRNELRSLCYRRKSPR
mmetsp:Transcript_1914/g.3079  ORF Transcript_1914/g.3079 Transcript_1914/m.3079 type:complete len:96 (-) Transcript_1914:282-569(-)